MSARIEWGGTQRNIQQGMAAYEGKVYEAIHNIAEYFAPVIEATAKTEAPWRDLSGNARQGLQGLVEDISQSVVAIVLQGGVDYQVFLELKNSARYAIIMPTLEAEYPEVQRMLKQVFS